MFRLTYLDVSKLKKIPLIFLRSNASKKGKCYVFIAYKVRNKCAWGIYGVKSKNIAMIYIYLYVKMRENG